MDSEELDSQYFELDLQEVGEVGLQEWKLEGVLESSASALALQELVPDWMEPKQAYQVEVPHRQEWKGLILMVLTLVVIKVRILKQSLEQLFQRVKQKD